MYKSFWDACDAKKKNIYSFIDDPFVMMGKVFWGHWTSSDHAMPTVANTAKITSEPGAVFEGLGSSVVAFPTCVACNVMDNFTFFSQGDPVFRVPAEILRSLARCSDSPAV